MSKVAVITRTKDRPAFLRRAIESVTGQTYTDYIHVIVNDGGDRNQIDKILEEVNPEHRDRIKLFHRPEASGAPDTIFSESVDRVESKYVVIHDDDDTWHPSFLEETVSVLESGAAGVLARTDRVYEKYAGSEITVTKKVAYMPDLSVISLYRQCIDNQLTPIAFIYRRDAYEEVGRYDATLPVAGDWEFGIRFLRKYDVEYVDPGYALANYHERTNAKDNSFAKHSHRKYVTLVANKYLRQDLENGGLGLGYIISKLKHDQDIRHGLIKRLIPRPILRMKGKR